MGGKHLKRLRAEKSKVHLKKKKLSKDQNLTHTAFTVKKIFTIEQLQKVDENEPVSNWNIPLKDLLIRSNHYNFTSRLNSLSGIKELLAKYPGIVRRSSVKPLISRLLELMTDEEHKIRITAADLLTDVFDFMLPTSIVPFYKILNLHLGCAMTHRNASVQRDSLKLIDVLMKCSPEALKYNLKSITSNFLRIIKNYVYESYASKFSSGRSKQEMEKVKIEMLHRFYKFLIAGYGRPSEPKEPHYVFCDNHVRVLHKERTSMRSLNDQYKKTPDLSVFKNIECEKLWTQFDKNKFINICSLVMPLIFDSWTESFLSQKHDGFLSTNELCDAGRLLSILLRILLFFYETAKAMKDSVAESWFISNYSSEFEKTFMSGFPFTPPQESRSSSFSDFSWENSHICMMNNLSICYLGYTFKVIDKKRDLQDQIECYILDALTVKNTANTGILSKVVEAAILSSPCKSSSVILRKVVGVYGVTSNSELQQNLLKILKKIVLEEEETVVPKDHSIRKWMKSLPERLCSPLVLAGELETISKIINTAKGTELLKEIEHKAGDIIGNLQHIQVREISQLKGQKMIADILYRCNGTVLRDIMKMEIWGKGMYPEDLEKYIQDIFSQKITN